MTGDVGLEELVTATESCGTARVVHWHARGDPRQQRRSGPTFEGCVDFPRRVSAGWHTPDGVPMRLLGTLLGRSEPSAAEQRTFRIFVGGCLYRAVDGGAHWLSDGDPQGPRQRIDPLWLLEQLPFASHGVTTLTGDVARPESAQEGYRTHLDLEAVRSRATTEGERSTIAATAEIVAEIWVDGRNRIRTMSYLVVLHGGPRTGAGAEWVTTELNEFGVPVDVDIPEPGQIVRPAQVKRWY